LFFIEENFLKPSIIQIFAGCMKEKKDEFLWKKKICHYRILVNVFRCVKR